MFRIEEVLLVTPESEEEEIRIVNKFPMKRSYGAIRKTFIVPVSCAQKIREFIEEEEKSDG